MRRTAISFAVGSIFASIVFLLAFDVTPKSKSPADTREFVFSNADNPSQREVRSEPEPSPTILGSEPGETQSAERASDEDFSEVFEPISMPPEFDFMGEDQPYWHEDAWRELHATLEREPRDPDWSYAAEATLGSTVNAKPDIIRYGTPAIHCRSETCQIQLLAYGGDDIDAGEWSTRFGTVYRELRDSFELEDFSIAQEGGLTAIVLHLSKREPPVLDSGP